MSEEREVYLAGANDRQRQRRETVFAGARQRRQRLHWRRLAVDLVAGAAGGCCFYAGLRIWHGGDAVEIAGAALLCFCLLAAAVLLQAGDQ